ncbi:Helix-turn-helix [Mucilaginibacter lappiensis]|uniref:Transcriptional regulator with XRE-family HTH domain n=1 Tax=Mucilaginibacter lappiensis TaxID=354630 RepID=A0ABR6PDH8_9SPHI|nr:helix-turn-helix transcriptional regulator [Mucilaginibacter lappiensis]MBB6107668.1 transcriptional regulator with XRE-family HTH domain [Mucilaginibacter lappiensis]SIQ01056.1 Helix-turn-helix [Mucilaginibacter lappiensis]
MENQFFEKENFGDKLKSIRVEKGLTKIELAHLSGISNVQINRYEKNTAKPSDLIIKKLSRALEMPFEDLAGITLKAKFDFDDLECSLERLKKLPEYDLIIIKEVIDRFTGNKEVKSVTFK